MEALEAAQLLKYQSNSSYHPEDYDFVLLSFKFPYLVDNCVPMSGTSTNHAIGLCAILLKICGIGGELTS